MCRNSPSKKLKTMTFGPASVNRSARTYKFHRYYLDLTKLQELNGQGIVCLGFWRAKHSCHF